MSADDRDWPPLRHETPAEYALRLERQGFEEMFIRRALRTHFRIALADLARYTSLLVVARYRHIVLLRDIHPNRSRFSLTKKLAKNLGITDDDAESWLARFDAFENASGARGDAGVTTLRPATSADVPRLARWDREPHVRDASGDDEPEDWPALLGDLPPDWAVLIIEAGARPVGVLQIIDPATEPSGYWRPWFEAQGVAPAPQTLRAIDIWIGEADALGLGHGTAAMRQALARCFAIPTVDAVLIDPLERNAAALRFYARLGFAALGPFRFGADDCRVMRRSRDAS